MIKIHPKFATSLTLIDNLKFFCSKDNMLVCAECARSYHLGHMTNLRSITSILQAQIPLYLDIKQKAEFLKEIFKPSEKIENFIKDKLNKDFEGFLDELNKYKSSWIKENYERIISMYPNMLVDAKKWEEESEEANNFAELIVNAEDSYEKILEYAENDKNITGDEILSMIQPEMFNSKFEEIATLIDKRTKLVEIKPTLLDKNLLQNIFKYDIHSDKYGVHLKYPIEQLSNFKAVYSYPYSHETTLNELSEIRDKNRNTIICVGARYKEEKTLALCGCGDIEEVFKQTEGQYTSHEHRGVWWYMLLGKSFGFSAVQNVDLNYADHLTDYGNQRLSWYITGSNGGFRAGQATSLNDNTQWNKLIYLANK